MLTADAIRHRRSIKRFAARPVSREEIETLLDAASLAPNHRLTQPWRFHVLGPAASGSGSFRALRETVADEHRALPAMIVVSVVQHADPEIREEDYAAVMMGVQNLALIAVDMGLGTQIRTGGVMSDPSARAAVGLGSDERIVAVVNVGAPADVPPPKSRHPATALTTWTD
jgi:nitroreductase